MSEQHVIRLKPNEYIHILNNNTNVSSLVVGPLTFTRKEHEKILFQPKQCINIPPRNYCRIKNPVDRKDGATQQDEKGQIKLKIGDEEIRFCQEPFPLYPGEQIMEDANGEVVSKLLVIPRATALMLKATRDFSDDRVERRAGDEWLFNGPGTYYPRVEVDVVRPIEATVIRANEALRLRARRQFTRDGVARNVGEEWLVRTPGTYLPNVDEEVVRKVQAKLLTEKVALHCEAMKTFTDGSGKERKAGSQWLITCQHASTHIPDVYEKILGEVAVTTLTNLQYCVVLNPVDENLKPQLGKQEVRKGECSFFLHPGESLRSGIQDVIILNEHEALLLRCVEGFADQEDGQTVNRLPGDKWLIRGPCDYVPPVEVALAEAEKRRALALDENEGVYVRDEKTGSVRSVLGKAYMLSPTEVLWRKELPPVVEELLQRELGCKHAVKDKGVPSRGGRVKTNVVRFNVQHNAACQIYDYHARRPRIVFGPDMVQLGPEEQFTVLSLSGDKPKVPKVITALQLFLGPDFMTDIVTVETSDHARLELKLSYNWQFDVDRSKPEEATKLFSVPDFVGDACKAIASRVRGAVASELFDSFHRNSAQIIRNSVFGEEASFVFPSNGLTVTAIDIQSVEPVDQKTRDSLQKSVQMAIEITTKSQEASARHEAARKDQEAKGALERQVIKDKAKAETARKTYLELQAETEAIESTGTAKAEGQARAEAAQIECTSEVDQAKFKAQAQQIAADAELAQLADKQEAELDYQQQLNEIELSKAKSMADIETKKFGDTVSAISRETLLAVAQAGPEMQAKLLEGLGLKGYLITDGQSPINLFNTAKGMIGGVP